MTVKALRRQLMAAIAMIVVSLIALSSSTYAWFTMNKTVTATGLKVQAKTEGGILIKRTAVAGKGSESVTFGSTSLQQLLPTSTSDALKWAHAAADSADDYKAKEGTYEMLTLSNDPPGANGLGSGTIGGTSSGNFYYVYDKFTIMKDDNSNSFTDLFVSECSVATANGSATALSKSLRVAVKCEDVTYIYAPVAGARLSYDVVTNVDKTTDPDTTTVATVRAKNSSNSVNQPLTASDGKLVDREVTTANGVDVLVYVYFEGEDDNHFTQNISSGTSLDELELTIKFSCTSVQ